MDGIESLIEHARFEPWTATGSEHVAGPHSGISQIFILISSNGEKILGNVA